MTRLLYKVRAGLCKSQEHEMHVDANTPHSENMAKHRQENNDDPRHLEYRLHVMIKLRRNDEALLAAPLTGFTWSSVGLVEVLSWGPKFYNH